MDSIRILIADDEPKMISLLRQILSSAGYQVLAANKGARAVQMAALEQPDMMIIDSSLADEMDGFEVLQRVREFSEIPLILLSDSSSPDDILRGFSLGADDFIEKPFNSKVLLARLQVIFKRSRGVPGEPLEIICEDMVINVPRRQVMLDGAEIYLSQTEFNLLLELARNRDRVLLHEQLLTAVWGEAYRAEVDYLRSYIHMLRRKLEFDAPRPRRIISKPGVGYMLLSSTHKNPGEESDARG